MADRAKALPLPEPLQQVATGLTPQPAPDRMDRGNMIDRPGLKHVPAIEGGLLAIAGRAGRVLEGRETPPNIGPPLLHERNQG